MWSRNPREKDWIAATKWVEEQLSLIDKYGTVMVSKPEHLRRSESYQNAL
jgi:hypothetical protein